MKRLLLIFMVLMSLFIAEGFSASHVSCGDSLIADTKMDEDLVCSAAGLVIAADGITLDCNGHFLTGNNGGDGISLASRGGVTIKNCNIKSFTNGIVLDGSLQNTIKDNVVTNSGLSGIVLREGSDENLVEGNELQKNLYLGIYLASSSDNLVQDNIIVDTKVYSIRMKDDADRNRVLNNVFEGTITDYGVLIQNADENVFVGNIVDGGGSDGVHLELAHFSMISKNVITRNLGDGIAFVKDSNSNLVKRNMINDNGEIGIVLLAGRANEFSENEISYNNIGVMLSKTANRNDLHANILTNNIAKTVYFDGSSLNELNGNIITHSKVGIHLLLASSNKIYNNLIYNHTQTVVITGDSDNTWNVDPYPSKNILGGENMGGNFISQPGQDAFSDVCEDKNLNGFCDEPNAMLRMNVDEFPLVLPSELDVIEDEITLDLEPLQLVTSTNGLTGQSVFETNPFIGKDIEKALLNFLILTLILAFLISTLLIFGLPHKKHPRKGKKRRKR